jgi:glucokinase
MRLALAIDLGGTNIRAAVVDDTGNILHRADKSTPARQGAPAVVAAIADAAAQALAQASYPSIAGMCVCSPGPLDTITGVPLGVSTIDGFDQFPLRDELQKALGQKVWLENDGIAACIGEWKQGAGKGYQSVVYMTVSTGVGGGVVVDGHVLRGRRGMAGHVGHLAILADGKRCYCGNPGCLEAYACGPAFADRAREKAALAPQSSLHAQATKLEPHDVFAASMQGDALATELVAEEARYLGIGITSLLHLYSPEVVIIGGGLSNSFDQLAPGITAYVQANAMKPYRDVPILKAALAGNSGLIGAAELVFATGA